METPFDQIPHAAEPPRDVAEVKLDREASDAARAVIAGSTTRLAAAPASPAVPTPTTDTNAHGAVSTNGQASPDHTPIVTQARVPTRASSASAGSAVPCPPSTAEGGGRDGAAATSPRRPGTFVPGNRAASVRRGPMGPDELRLVAQRAMTKTGMKKVIRRLQSIASEGSARDAIAASKLLIALGGVSLMGVGGSPVLQPPTDEPVTVPRPPAS